MAQKVNQKQVNRAFSTTEALTGDTWIDGKPIYRQTYSLTTAASGNNEQVFNTTLGSAVTRIIKVEGGIQSSGLDYWPLQYVNPNATTLQNSQMKVSYVNPQWQIRGNWGGVGSLIVTIYYVK